MLCLWQEGRQQRAASQLPLQAAGDSSLEYRPRFSLEVGDLHLAAEATPHAPGVQYSLKLFRLEAAEHLPVPAGYEAAAVAAQLQEVRDSSSHMEVQHLHEQAVCLYQGPLQSGLHSPDRRTLWRYPIGHALAIMVSLHHVALHLPTHMCTPMLCLLNCLAC